MSIRENIKQRMDELRWSQSRLSAESGVSQSGISAILTGKVEPSVSTVQLLANALGVEVESLVSQGQVPPASAKQKAAALINSLSDA